MTFSLQNVVPWGRSFREYQRMFALTPDDLRHRILGCADGPASFNSEVTAQGADVVSVDPIYAFHEHEIRDRIAATYPVIMEQTCRNRSEFVWEEYASPEELVRLRLAAMDQFLVDYAVGREQGRFIAAELPTLPFADQSFDLALCSHFLFLYSEQLSDEFHIDSIEELCRVAVEVRIFPLLELGSVPSRHVVPVMHKLESLGWKVDIEMVPYEFQRGGNQMMRITRRKHESANDFRV